MAKLSRQCIHDTLAYKRNHFLPECQLTQCLYVVNIRNLRLSQLAPYQETRWRKNRFLEMQRLKRSASEIVITVRGGLVQEVRSTNPYTKIYIADYDIHHDDLDEEYALSEAEERGIASDMHIVY